MLKNLARSLMLCVPLAIVSGTSFAFTGQQFAPEAKITLEQARAKALTVYPGSVTDQELEKERGGTGLRYSFDIRNGATTHEVGVDARTGAILENSAEGPKSD